MIGQQITSLLEDACSSSLLVHISAFVGAQLKDHLQVADVRVTEDTVRPIFAFRNFLIRNDDREWDRPLGQIDAPDMLKRTDLQTYLRASSLEMPFELHAWCKAGKRIVYVRKQVNVPTAEASPEWITILNDLPSESIMLWFEEVFTSTYEGREITCNLALLTKVGQYWYLRLFLNPHHSPANVTLSYAEQHKLANMVKRPGTKMVTTKVDTKERKIPKRLFDSLEVLKKFSGRFTERYAPRGMAGALLAVFDPAGRHSYVSSHLKDMMWQVMSAVVEWRKSSTSRDEEVLFTEPTTRPARRNTKIPTQQRIFAPESIFEIRQTRYSSSNNSRTGSGPVDAGRGGWEHEPHDRTPHMRRLPGHKHLPPDQQVWRPVRGSRVRKDKDPSPGAAPGTLVKPPKKS